MRGIRIMKALRLVVIIPALNEEATIAAVIKEVPRDIAGISKVDVLVVNDGSTDSTKRLAEEAGARVVSHDVNYGVGRAYSTGIDEALKLGADIIVNIDADAQFNPADIRKLIQPILDGEAEFVTASRFKDSDKIPEMSWIKLCGNRMMSQLISNIVGRKLHDVSCGFRACTREAALQLNLSGSFTYTQETFLDLAAKKIHIVEMPMVVRGTREVGKSKVASNLFKYGNRTMRIIVRAYKDYWPWQFFSAIAMFCFAVAIILGGFLISWRVTQGKFTPHIWSGFVGAFFFAMGMICLLIGMVGDMLLKIRMNLERLLYFHRKDYYDKSREGSSSDDR